MTSGVQVGSAYVALGADGSQLNSDLKRAEGTVKGWASGLSKAFTVAGAGLTASVTAPLAVLGKQSMDFAKDFDTEMRNIQSISKDTDAGTQALGKTFLSMSQDIKQTTDTASELADGFYQIQSSGFAGSNAMEVLQSSSKAATAGLTTTEVAAGAITATLNAYGLASSEATHVSDVLFKTVDIGVVTFEEMASQLGDVVGTANTAGVSIEEIGAATATMTKGGIGAAETMTSLNQLMLSFISPSKESAEAAAEMGLDLSAAALESKGLAGVMAEVQAATGGNVEEMAKLFPNVRALRGALSLTRGEMAPFKQDLEAIAGSTGATQAAFDIQTKSFEAQAQSFKNSVDAMKIGIGTVLLPMLNSITSFIAPLVQKFQELDPATQRMVVIFGIIAAAAGPVLLAMGAIAGAIAAIGAPVLAIIGVLGLLAAAWATNFGGIRETVMGVIQPVIDAINTAIGVFQALDAAGQTTGQSLLGAFTAFLGSLIGFQEASALVQGFQEKWEALVSFFEPTIERLKAGFATMVESMAPLGGKLGELGAAFETLWTAVEPVVSAIAEVVGGVLVAAFNLLLEIVAAVMPSVGEIISTAIDIGVTVLNTLATVVTEVVNIVKAVLEGDWAAAWTSAQTIIETVVTAAGTILEGLASIVVTVMKGIVDGVKQWMTNLYGDWQTKWEALVGVARTKFYSILGHIIITLNNIKSAITGFDLKEAGHNLMEGLKQGIVEMAGNLAEAGRNVIEGVISAIWARIRKGSPSLEGRDMGLNLTAGLVAGLDAGAPEAAAAAGRSAQSMIDRARSVFDIRSPSGVFQEIGRQMMEGLALGLSESEQKAWEALAKTFENLIQISEGLSMISGYRANANLSSNLTGMIGQMKDVVTQLADMAGWLATPRPGQRDPDWVSAKAGTDPMKDIANNIMAMAEGLAALGEFKPVGDVAPKVTDLVNGYKEVVRQFAEFAGWLVTSDNFPGGLNLADAVGALGVIATVADAFGAIFDAWKGVASAGSIKIPGDMTAMLDSIVSMMTLVIEKLGGMQTEISDELIDKAGRLADVAGTFGSIAKAWETVSGFKTSKVDVTTIVDFLKGFADQVLVALNEVSKTAPAMSDNWQTFTGNVKAAIGLIADVAKAWETVSDFQPNDKLDLDGEDGKGGVVRWLAGLAGLATRAIMEVQQWGGLTPNDQFNAFATSVKAAIGLIGDAAKAWETVQDFEWSTLKIDGDEGVINWLASMAGIATRAIEKVQAWGGITPNEQFNAFVVSVKNAIGLIADTAKAWESLQGFKPNNKRLDMNVVVDWLANLAGLALRAMERVQSWGGIAPNEAFNAFTTAIKNAIGALSDTLKFVEALSLWKSAGSVSDKVTELRDDLGIIIDEIVIAQTNMQSLVTDSLLKFVANISTLATSMATVVDLLKSIDELENTGDVPLAVDRIGSVIRTILTELADIIYDINDEKEELLLSFGSAIGGLMGGLREALTLAMALPQSWARPNESMWASFTVWVQEVMGAWQSYVDYQYKDDRGPARLDLLSKFSSAMSSLMTGLKSALDLALAVPKTWARPNDVMWASFTLWVQEVMGTWQTYVDYQYKGETGPARIDLLSKFASAMSSVMSALKAALELAIAVPKTWTRPNDSMWAAFTLWLQEVMGVWQTYVDNQYKADTGPARVDLLSKFGAAMSSLMSALKTSLELALAVPKTWARPNDATWASFTLWVQEVMGTWQTYVDYQYKSETGPARLALVGSFATAMQSIMGALKTALDLALALPTKWTAIPTGEGSPYSYLKAFVEKVFTDFQAYVTANFPADSEAAKNLPVVQAFAGALNGVMGALATALDVFKGLQGYIPLLDTRIENFIGSVTHAYGLIQTYATGEGVQAGAAATQAFASSLSTVFQALSTGLDLFKALTDPAVYRQLVTAAGTETPIDGFKTALQALISRITTTLGSWKTYVETEASTNWGPVADAFKLKVEGVFGVLNTALNLFKDLNTAGMPSPTKISDFLEAVIGLFRGFVTGIQDVPEDVETAGKDTGTALSKWPGNWAQYFTAYSQFGGNLATQMVSGFSAAMNDATKVGTYFYNLFQAAIVTAPTTIMTGSASGQGGAAFYGHGKTLATQFGSGFKAQIDWILVQGTSSNSFQVGVQAVVTHLSSSTWILNMQTLGGNFANNFALGWKAAMTAQAQAGSFMLSSTYAVTDAIKAAIKKAFGIASPSKVMMGYGEMVAAGLGSGMLAGVPDVSAAAASLYRAAQPYVAMGGEWDVNARRTIVVRFEGQAGGGVPLSPVQFSELTRQLAYAISIGA